MPCFPRCDTDVLLARVRHACRSSAYSARTEEAYVQWIRRFVRFHRRRRPRDMGVPEVAAYLAHLTEERGLAPSTRNQALDALRFLYAAVLRRPLGDARALARVSCSREMPAPIARGDVRRLYWALEEPFRLMVGLLYGSGLRLMECVRLRVGDPDFRRHRLLVRATDGRDARHTLLPPSLEPSLQRQVARALRRHWDDARGADRVAELPPAAAYLFPGMRRTVDPSTGSLHRRHVSPSALQKTVRRTARQAGIERPALCKALRKAFATELLARGWPLPRVQEMMGHKDVRTTHAYLRLVDDAGAARPPGEPWEGWAGAGR